MTDPGRVSEHFSLNEVTGSANARELHMDNTPPKELIPGILLAAAGMERIRWALGGRYPIQVHSWYRCEALNAILGGVPGSQHTRGEAVDFTCPKFGSPRQIALVLSYMIIELRIDQLILEPTWVHVSFVETPRRQVLTAVKGPDGMISYEKGIV